MSGPASPAARTPPGGSAAASTSSSPTRSIRNGNIKGAKDASSSRMYGTLQVVDVSDIEHPKAVAWYTPEMRRRAQRVAGGRHALSRRLRRRLPRVRHLGRAQRRPPRAAPRDRPRSTPPTWAACTKNAAFDWGVVVNPKDGLAYVNDFNNGLWVVRVDPEEDERPAHAVSAAPGACWSPRSALCATRRRRRRPRPRPATTWSSSRAKGTTGSRWCGSARAAPGSSGSGRSAPTRRELVGPHGLYVSPDGKWYYVSTAHGTPNGALWKFSTETDEQAGRVELGGFRRPCRSRPAATTPGW